MSVGPFDEPINFDAPSEYGGAPGLVQKHPDHVLSVGEVFGITTRAAMLSEDGVDPKTGIDATQIEAP